MKAFLLGRFFFLKQTFNVPSKGVEAIAFFVEEKKNLFSNVQGKLHFTFMVNFPCLWVNGGNVAYGS